MSCPISDFASCPCRRVRPRNWSKRSAAMVTAHLSDNMNRLVAGGAALRPMHGGGKLCGPALTVKVAPGDNLMVHKAIDIAAPGDVIVVDAGGVLTGAIIGDIMSSLAEKRGVAGMVIYGAIRDAAEIRCAALSGVRLRRHPPRPVQERTGRNQRAGRLGRDGGASRRHHRRRHRRRGRRAAGARRGSPGAGARRSSPRKPRPSKPSPRARPTGAGWTNCCAQRGCDF